MFPSVRKAVSALFRSDEPAASSSHGQAIASTSQASLAVNQSEDSEDVAQLLDELGAESPSKEGSDNRLQSDMDTEGGSQGFERVCHSQESPDVGQLLDELGADSQSQGSSAHAKESGQAAPETARPAERQAAVDASDSPGQIYPGVDNMDDLGLELEMCPEDARILAALPEWQPDYRPPASSGSLSSSADAEPQPGLGFGPTLEGGDPLGPSAAEDAAPSRKRRRTSASSQPEDDRAASSQDQPVASSQAESAQRPATGEEASSSQEDSQHSAAQSCRSGTAAPEVNIREEEVITISDNTPGSEEKQDEESQSLLANDGMRLRKRVLRPYKPNKNLRSPPSKKKQSCGAPAPPAAAEESSQEDRVGSCEEGSQPSAPQTSKPGQDAPGLNNVGGDEVISVSDNTPGSQEKQDEELAKDEMWLQKRALGRYRPRKKNLRSPSSKKTQSCGAPSPPAAAEEESSQEDEVAGGGRGRERSRKLSDGCARRQVNQSPVPCTTARSLRRLGREEGNHASENEASADTSPAARAPQVVHTLSPSQRLISSFLTRTVRVPPARGQDGVPALSSRPSRSSDSEAQENEECVSDSQVQCDSPQQLERSPSDGGLAAWSSEVFSADDILSYAREMGISESSFFESSNSDSQEEDILTRAEPPDCGSTEPDVLDEIPARRDAVVQECNNRSVNFTAEDILDYMRRLDLAETPSLAGMWKGSPRKPRPELRGLMFSAADILEFQRRLDIPPTVLHTHTEVSPVVERRRPLGKAAADRGSGDFNLLTLQLPPGPRCQVLAFLDQFAQ